MFVVLMVNNVKIVIIHFIAELRDAIFRPDYNFRSWKYVTFKVRYLSDLEAEESDISFDSEYEITLNNRAYLLKNVPELKIKKMIFFISIRDVGNKIVNTNKYVIIIAYVNEIINNITKIICFTIKIHFVNDLKINILFETNIMTFQEMIMNLKTRILKFEKCQKLQISIDVIARIQSHFKRIIRNKFSIIIISNIIAKILIVYNDITLKNRDFLFESNCSQNFEFTNEILIHVVNFTILIILIYNVTIAFIRLSRKIRFEALFEYKQNDVFLTTSVDAFLVIENVKLWKSNLVKNIMITITTFIEFTQKSMLKTFIIQIDLDLEHIMFNDIIIYDTSKVIIQITFVIDEFSEIWKNQDIIVNISEKE